MAVKDTTVLRGGAWNCSSAISIVTYRYGCISHFHNTGLSFRLIRRVYDKHMA